MKIRAEQPGDVAAIHAVHVACFPGDGEAKLVDRLRDDGQLLVSLVAVDGDAIVGHVAFSPVTVAGRRTDVSASLPCSSQGVGLAPVAVLASHRRQGIAAALVREGLAACREADCGWVVVLGEPAYYSRLGFRAASQFGLSDAYGGGDAFQVIELVSDTLPHGAGRVEYAQAFAMFE